MRFGATIVAGVIYFALSFASAILLEVETAVFEAVLYGIVKTAIFCVLFHYAHNWLARLFDWYDPDETPAATPIPQTEE